ncbi:hypothetical protein TD95_003762 [Thielaviopsis punctulata]|uniref:SWR1-complex protein 5 n=1 Tax=Thielaviopsis punctulata TaxID=72032 RepID=A0A0F4ZL18_9PEZI|nr:hypothetical protein TD95_003762 [Thielaviopsis punctulata]
MPSPAAIVDENDDNYVSEEDSDFAPDAGPNSPSDNDDSDNEDGESKVVEAGEKRKTEDADFENSGDETVIKRGKKKRRKTAQDDDGGDGGLVKTRSQRAAEKEERKTALPDGLVTIDVDAMFASMMAGNYTTQSPSTSSTPVPATSTSAAPTPGPGPEATSKPPTAAPSDADADTILIKRKYNFAGKVHMEEKLVPRSSAEAKLYLESLSPADAAAALSRIDSKDKDKDAARPAPRRAFRSRFEPPVDQVTRRADLQLGVALRMQARHDAQAARAKKLNTVEKSRMDWAGYVDKEGLKDELVLAGRAKGSFAERQEFLARTEARREDEARKARMVARAQKGV